MVSQYDPPPPVSPPRCTSDVVEHPPNVTAWGMTAGKPADGRRGGSVLHC